MSGIMFNGVEMKNGEDKAEYINRVLMNMGFKSDVEGIKGIVTKLDDEKQETKKDDEKQETNKKRLKKLLDEDLSDTDDNETDETISDCSSSDDDAMSDTDDELTAEHLEKLGLTYFKRVMLGTYDCSMEEHDDAVRWFNNKYGTVERGSNGSKGHYFTHGEEPYNLFKMKKLKSIYDRKIKSVTLYGIKIHITFIDPTTDDLKVLEEYTNIINNYKSQRDNDRHIELRECVKFNHLVNFDVVENKRDYNHGKTTHEHKWKIGDVIFSYVNPFLKYITFWQVVKITNKMLKVRPLKPIMTIKHINEDSPNRVYVFKYKKDLFIEDVKSKYVNKRSHNTVYNFDDYILRLFKEQND